MKKNIFFIFIVISLFLYSFTQVDLNLTLSHISLWYAIQDFFQNIGYFNRPFSTLLYILIILSLFIFYFFILKLADKNKFSLKSFWQIVIISSLILLFSYPAFSYDLFNYMFDARIITKYGQNPYLHKALDYPTDPWTNFMRWTHRYYPYGPFWLIVTVPLSFLGMGFFLPTMYLFKALIVASYLGTIFIINKILVKHSKANILSGLFFFAFNPLVIIESLVSAHNDMLMIFLAMLAIFLLFEKKYIGSIFFLLLSGAIKFATFIVLPLFILKIVLDREKKMRLNNFIFAFLSLMLISLMAVIMRTQFQPWYLLYLIPFASLIAEKKFISWPLIIMSFGALLLYIPYLYTGGYNTPIPFILNSIIIFFTIFAIIVFIVILLKNNRLSIVKTDEN